VQELTGLVSSKEHELNFLDSHPDRYAKLRNSASRFLVIQYGLCAFQWNAAEKRFGLSGVEPFWREERSDGFALMADRFDASPFSFYTFPRPLDDNSDNMFLCSSGNFVDITTKFTRRDRGYAE